MKKILKKLKPYWPMAIICVILVAGQAILELYLPRITAGIIDTGLRNGDIPYIWKQGGYMLIVALGTSFCAIVSTLLASKLAANIARDLRKQIFQKVSSFSLGEFDKISTSSLITRTTNDVTQIHQFVFTLFRLMTLAPCFMIGSLIMTLRIDLKICLILAVSVPVMLILIFVVGKLIIPLFSKMQKKIDRLTLVAREGLTGVRVIRAFGQEQRETERYNAANKEVTDISIRANRIFAVMMPCVMLIMNFTMVAVYWFGAKRISVGGFGVGDITSITQYIMHVMYSIVMVTMLFMQIPRAMASANRINEVLETEPSVTDENDAPVKEQLSESGVEFKHVDFRFPGAEKNVLSDINFFARRGQTTAIVGSTGSGKSTIINLISRFYDVSAGEVLINGVDVKGYTQKDLRMKVGFVPQKAFLFSGTIADNLKFGKEDATEEEMWAALETAQAEHFVSNKEGKLEAEVAQGGNNFSGGQKQRLSIARALVRKPEIYIFDDSFSALDFKTDAKLRAALKLVTKDAAVIIVAQRISTVMDADNILVVNDGEIVGQGTHRQLLADCEVYREIAESQLDEEELYND